MPKKLDRDTEGWLQEFRGQMSARNWTKTIDCLDARKTSHANTAPKRIKDLVISSFQKSLNAETRLEVAHCYCDSASDTAKEIGLMLLVEHYGNNKQTVEAVILKLGNDNNWEVREWAAGCVADIICLDSLKVASFLDELSSSSFPNLRRLVAVAIGYSSQCISSNEFAKLVEYLRILLFDDDQYVKKNLGPFAIGTYAISYQPDLICSWLKKMLAVENENVLWNLGMVLTTEAGSRYAKELFPIILRLVMARDHKRLRNVASKALRNLSARSPDVLEDLMKTMPEETQLELKRLSR